MSVTLTGGTGLFDRIGKLGKILFEQNSLADGLHDTYFPEIVTSYGSDYTLLGNLPSMLTADRAALASIGPSLQAMAVATLNSMVNADAPQANPNDVGQSIAELIRQMSAASKTVQKCTTTVSTSAGSGNYGNATVVASVLNGDGLMKQYCFSETGTLVCQQDSQTGGATLGSESWQYRGDAAEGNVHLDTWPAGSGAVATITEVDSLTTGQNLLSNSSWETATATGWTGWTIRVGTFNTHLASDASVYYRGTLSMAFVGDASTLTGVYQIFDSTSGTTSELKPSTVYNLVVRHKVNTAPAAGVLAISLTDGSNTTLTDAASTSNSKSVTLSGLTSSWSSTTITFVTPRVLPTETRLQIKLTTALSSGTTLYIDDVCMNEATQLYEGGPYLSVFAGSTKTIVADRHTITVANDRGSSSYSANFQALFDRWFNMRALKLQLPYAASPNIADSLITG